MPFTVTPIPSQVKQYNDPSLCAADLINGNIPIAYLNSLSSLHPSDPFDTLDLQSLPSLMSPDPSMKDHHSDSFDDDEDMDAYDIFATPGHGPSRQMTHQQYDLNLQQQQQYHRLHLQQQQQQPQQLQYNQQMQSNPPLQDPVHAEERKPVTPLQILRPNHPMVLQRTVSMPSLHQYFANPLLQYQQHQQQQQPSQASQPLPEPFTLPLDQQPLASAPVYSHSSFSSVSSSPAYHVPGAARFAPLSEALIDPLDHYLSCFQSQRPILENTIPALDQDMDLMMLSSLILSPTTEQDDASLYSATASNSIFSSPLSWNSRDNSPRLSPRMVDSLQVQDSSFSSSSSSSTPLHFNFSTPTSISSVTPASAPASASSTTTPATPATPAAAGPKRRKRVRPPTVKKPKKIRPTSFACAEPGCGKVFSRAYNLTSHMKTHSSERPFLCGACPLAFARRHDRERHIRLHTGEKPYSCTICGAGFMRNDALLRHQKLCGLAGSSFEPIMDHHYMGLRDNRDGDDDHDMEGRGRHAPLMSNP